MEATSHIDVLVVGAGAAGLTLAIDLARRGVRFRLVEQRAEPFAGSRGKGIQPRTQEVFEDLGVLDRLFAIGDAYPDQRVHRADGSFVQSPMMEVGHATLAEPYHMPLMVPQFLTEQVLAERLAELGEAVNYGIALTGFDQHESGVTARLLTASGEETVEARYLIGTDGGRSFVRNALGVDFPGKTLGVRAVVADLHLEGLTPDAWHRWNEDDMTRQLGLCPLAGTDLFQLQAPVPLEGEVDTSVEGLAAMVRDRTGRDDIVVRGMTWGSAYNMNARLADRYRLGRVFLAGDAAHTHPPTGGQGLNTSVQDAYNLGWKLAAALRGAPDALLDSYEGERRPIAAAMLGLSTRLLDESKAGVMRRGREVHQLDIGYPGSPLSRGSVKAGEGIRAGDRAPDAPLVGAAGQPRRLFDVMRGPQWTAIGSGVARTDAPLSRVGMHVHRIGADGDLRDASGAFAAAYGVAAGTWVVIRPDGYVGAIVPDAAAVDAYLADLGFVPAG